MGKLAGAVAGAGLLGQATAFVAPSARGALRGAGLAQPSLRERSATSA
eukprot:CAMPEP_0179147522 /NCGR_PEP_ID=MMETSP0796-20121207/71321_1 /TAXON_ID=73915 /ORGANISM="Pyrodinium bahamense, Strain pbaha01" /LENGTH=47 /DNA_ID= /DNA_START= /DNA_END= /DNA_ORIENTATION=